MTIWPTPGHFPGENLNSKRCMHPNVHCITIYHSHDMQHFFNYSQNGKNKTTLKQTVSKQGVKFLGLCKSRDLKIINKARITYQNQVLC